MKYFKTISLLAVMLLFTSKSTAQNIVESSKIGFYAEVVADKNSGQYVKDKLQSILDGIILQNGLGDIDNHQFVLLAKMTLIDESTTATVPPIYKVVYNVQLIVADNLLKKKYGVYNIYNCIGINRNRERASMNSLNKIKMNRQIVKFLKDKKQEIVEYYGLECGDLVTEASTLSDIGDYDAAIKLLRTIPKTNEDCFNMSQQKIKTVYKAKLMAGGSIDNIGKVQDTVAEVAEESFVIENNDTAANNVITENVVVDNVMVDNKEQKQKEVVKKKLTRKERKQAKKNKSVKKEEEYDWLLED